MTAHSRFEPAVWFPAIRSGSGADVFTERLAEGLRQRGLRAEITWLPLRAEYAPWTVPLPVPPPWAKIVHVNSWLHKRFLPLGLPIISTVHSGVHSRALNSHKSPLQRFYHRFWIRRMEAGNLTSASRLVAISHYASRLVQSMFDLTVSDVIPNGVDVDVFCPGSRVAPNKPFRLLYVGNWNPLKGVDLLAPIMGSLGDGFELIFTADRDGRHGRHALPSNSRNLGRLNVHQLVNAYRQADALLFPSRLEGFGLVAAEAMACGLPVISSNATAIPEVVEDGVTGLLCPTDDVEAFVDAVRRLAGDQQLWLKMREHSRSLAVQKFSSKLQVQRWVELYRSVSVE